MAVARDFIREKTEGFEDYQAYRNENHTPPHIHWRHVKEIALGTYLSMSCNHCDSPECFRVCPKRAFTKEKTEL